MKENNKYNGNIGRNPRWWFFVLIVVGFSLPAWYFDFIIVDVFGAGSSGDGEVHATEKHDDDMQKHSSLRHGDFEMNFDHPAIHPTLAYGQHLLLDLKGSSFDMLNDEEYLREATLRIIQKTQSRVLGIQSQKLEPQGVSVVAMLAGSHASVHTWPEFGSAIIDLFIPGSGTNLQEQLEYVAQQYGGNLKASTYSIVPRGNPGNEAQADETEPQFRPAEIMPAHKYKTKVFEVQSPFQHVAIWDHHDTQADDFGTDTTRSLFLDGVIQSNVFDEEKYHESLVHPAFVGSAQPVKRVLIVGGGEGGTLRESLKWKSVEKVFMVELDKAVIDASRQYLPSYSNCTGFGTPSCFDDPRVELYTQDFLKWFDDYIGNDICDKSDSKQDLLFDVIILDLLDSEKLPEGEEWAEELYSDDFFERIACATTDYGAVVSYFGEAPFSPFDGGPFIPLSDDDMAHRDMFLRKIEQIQTMSEYFRHFRVYDTSIPSYRADWAFAIGMVPRHATTDEDGNMTEDFEDDVATGVANAGINAFDGKVALVNLKINRGLHEKADLVYYDGAVQHSFQYPSGDWQGVYCMVPEHKNICDLPGLFFKAHDYEDEWFEIRLNDGGDETSGIVAKQDIPKGHITGLFDAATSVEMPATTFYALAKFAKGKTPEYRKFFDSIHRYGFDGGSDETGDTVFMGALSYHVFANHACGQKPQFADISEVWPWAEVLFHKWNPVGTLIRSELNFVIVATRDIKKGEMIMDDYTRWDGFMHNDDGEQGHSGVKKWCQEARRRLDS